MNEVTSVEQQQQHTPVGQGYNHYQMSMFAANNCLMHNEHSYPLPHLISPSRDVNQNNVGGSDSSAGYHPYQPQQHSPPEHTNSISSSSPRSLPLQCEKCGAFYENANQLGEHIRASHSNSQAGYSVQPQYQQLGNSYQQQNQQLHTSESQTVQQQQGYNYNGGQAPKSDVEQEPEKQAKILDLDSYKVETRRFEEELMRLHQQQQQQELQMQMHQQQIMQPQHPQQRIGANSVNSMLGWSPATQPHEYHPGFSPMGPMDNASSIGNEGQFMRCQQMPVAATQHARSPIISSTQQMASHQLPTELQPPKPPPLANQTWKSYVARRPKTYNCTACNKWFTSSGHLKRHYNTMLHKNAVKQSNQPDPANLPISVHHHPDRENAGLSSNGIDGGQSGLPELSSLGSSPNLMAGPSGEAVRGLLHMPTTLYNSNSSSNSEPSGTGVPVTHQQQQPPTGFHSSPTMVPPINSSAQFSMADHHQQQMGSQCPQMTHHLQQQFHHLSINSPPGQIPVHHLMNSPMSPMHPPTGPHLNSSMGSSPITSGSVHLAMASPPVTRPLTTIPQQPYPNALPTNVTTTIDIPDLLESITNQPTNTGNELSQVPCDQQQQPQNMLPGFGTFRNHQKSLPSFTQFAAVGFPVGQNQHQAVNAKSLNPEENLSPENASFESAGSTYDPYTSSPSRYESSTNTNVSAMPNTDALAVKQYEIQTHLLPPHQHQAQSRGQDHYHGFEANNNLAQMGEAKEEVDPNIGGQSEKDPNSEGTTSAMTKEHQVTSTSTGFHYISQDGFHKCIECDKTFNKACYLTQHNKSFHSGDKPFKCNQCGKRFFLEYLLAEHLRKHAGDKPYKCEMCPKQFNHKTDLRRHMCLHTGDKPHACDNCGKGFIRKDHMMKHLETHRKKSNHNLHLRA